MTKRNDGERIERPVAVPAQEDEADIIDELGAVQDENGEYQASIEDVRKAGAMDIDTIRRNRQIENVAKRKQKGEKVSISTDDVLVLYEGLLKTWPTSTLHAKVRRLSGGPGTTEMITSFPRSATELYDEIKAKHGQCAEATYEVEFLDANSRQWRGRAKITMPDARTPYMRGQPQNGAPQNGYGQQQPPPQASPPPQPASPFAMLQEALDTVQRLQGMQPMAQQPQPQPLAPGAPPASPFALLQEALDTVQRLQGMQPLQPAAAPQQPAATPQQQQLNEALQLVEALQRVAQGGRAPARQMQQPRPQPQYPQQQQSMPVPPTRPAPEGMMWEWMPEYETFALVSRARPVPTTMHRSGPRPAHSQQDDSNGQPPYFPNQQPQRQQSPADQVRDALGVVRQTMHAVREMGSVLGQPEHEAQPVFQEPDDDSPVKIVESGSSKLVYDQKDGSLRPWDSVLANLPGMMKWAGEQREAIQKVAEERQRREHRAQQQQLPQSEYVAVPVDDRLPPPPQSVPPPIESEPVEDSPWGAPTTPGGQD